MFLPIGEFDFAARLLAFKSTTFFGSYIAPGDKVRKKY